jgi:VanZ family protein
LKVEANSPIKKQSRFLVYWFPVAVYMALIFFLSSRSTLPALPRIPYVDKICHCTEYAILGYLLTRALIHENGSWLSRNALLVAIAIAIIFGLSDEIHQIFVPLRQCDMFDLLADSIGASIGAWTALCMQWFINHRQRKGHE